MRDLAYVYRDLCEAQTQLEDAVSDAEFLTAQARFEQVEAEWLELGKALDWKWGKTNNEIRD